MARLSPTGNRRADRIPTALSGILFIDCLLVDQRVWIDIGKICERADQ